MTERTTLRAAVAQMCSADTHAANIATVTELAAQAVGQGAELLCLPEVAGLMNRNAEVARGQVVEAEDDPFLAACRNLAARHGIWIHAGSTPVLGPDGRFLNHSAVIDAAGAIRATYDKVHLFDVAIEGQAPIGESKRFAPGEAAVILDTPWGPWGLSICYDLRFPYFYRRYGQEGATLIFIPSAFTVPTGRAHWEILIRARAIETGAFVLAAAQAGHHADGRETWGHAMAVDPWGAVLADLGREAPGLAVVELDLSRVEAARRQIPALQTGQDVPLRRL
ncbi:carbon-nitrogen hydrolase family protein [Roseibacterium sp. SDUM158016]|uniref:carbon-nitrogen hydrolase family protein n=1 Tax=Roseicyclus sediminis TaxID=2980997 RepID=UPI0021CF9D35|nr:carbon-nitrogen hydrolase family protein [Roseibacterium sp. SDUM158016]MCU4653023.1 carbon-nitrogen hydrolase family protein [Roseibacterium sp. SDUM158016]